IQVNSREIYFIPCINPDGYVYSHDVGVDWRKNRRPFPQYGTVGVDLNRNYGGSTDGHPEGEWGTTIGSITHNPNDATYCGPSPFSEAETSAERDFILSRDFCAGITFHTHSELVLWSWGYGYYTPPNNDFVTSLGTGIASLIAQEDYSGTYFPQQSAELYPTTGDATDWGFGTGHYERGADFIFFTIEECQQFQPPTSHLAQVVRENFDGAYYLLQQAGTIRSTLTPRVIPPVIADIGTVPSGEYTVEWTEVNPAANPTRWQVDELTDVSVITDDVEGTADRWEIDGFSVSTVRKHSGSKSFKSSMLDETADVLTSTHAYYVEPDDSLTFWIWYDIEEDWDYGYVEVSLDGRKFDILELYTGASAFWVREAISLEGYVGRSVFFRFRYTTDSYTLEEGMYVDDIYPAVFYNSITTLSSNVLDTHYDITGQTPGTYYYRVRGYNAKWFWCDQSTLEPAIVGGAASGTLAGTVTDSLTGAPLDGVYIEVLDGATPIGSDETVGGAYEITGLTPGTYDVSASSMVHQPKSVTGVVITDGNTTVVDFELVSIYGRVSGTVADSVLHVALSGVSIQLAQGSSVITTSTDSTGYYLLEDVESGSYEFTASLANYHSRFFSSLIVTSGLMLENSFDMMPVAVCGDADASGSVDIDDAVFLITYIFAGGPAPSTSWTGDADCSGEIDIDDVVYLVTYIFAGGLAPCESC
ncbi:MAG: carboxypeptidase regulatory-like domain-containing protein, partial [candidate division Zixibacteria bacterium]|nr:carboxypeptidase regulatory-like domain-containing protein [candidate division Zixibacteria bacterium]